MSHSSAEDESVLLARQALITKCKLLFGVKVLEKINERRGNIQQLLKSTCNTQTQGGISLITCFSPLWAQKTAAIELLLLAAVGSGLTERCVFYLYLNVS